MRSVRYIHHAIHVLTRRVSGKMKCDRQLLGWMAPRLVAKESLVEQHHVLLHHGKTRAVVDGWNKQQCKSVFATLHSKRFSYDFELLALHRNPHNEAKLTLTTVGRPWYYLVGW